MYSVTGVESGASGWKFISVLGVGCVLVLIVAVVLFQSKKQTRIRSHQVRTFYDKIVIYQFTIVQTVRNERTSLAKLFNCYLNVTMSSGYVLVFLVSVIWKLKKKFKPRFYWKKINNCGLNLQRLAKTSRTQKCPCVANKKTTFSLTFFRRCKHIYLTGDIT